MNRRWLLALLGITLGCCCLTAETSEGHANPALILPPCNSSSSQSAQWYDYKLDSLASQFRAQNSTSNEDAPRQAALLERIYDLRSDVSDAGKVDSILEAAKSSNAISPLARSEAAFLSVLTKVHRGQFTDIEDDYAALGYQRHWRISSAEFPLAAIGSEWKEFSPGPGPWLEIGDIVGQTSPYITLETWIQSKQPQDVDFRFSSAAPAKLQLNHRTILESRTFQPVSFDQYQTTVHLALGPNRIRIRLFRDSAYTELRAALRISDASGVGIALPPLPLSSNSAEVPASSDIVPSLRNSADLLGIARGRAAGDFETLYWLEKFRQLPASWSDLKKSTELKPGAELFYELAQHENEPAEKLDLLHQAIALDPGFIPAMLKAAELYSLRAENYKALSLLSNVLNQHPCEAGPGRLLADLGRTLGHSSLALAQINELASRRDLSIRDKRQLANQFLEFGLLNRARSLANAAYAQNSDGIEERQLKTRLDEQALDAEALLGDYVLLHALYPYDRLTLKRVIFWQGRTGRQKEALSTIGAALQVAPEDRQLLTLREELTRHPSALIASTLPKGSRADGETLRKLLSGETVAISTPDHDRTYLEDADTLAAQWRSHSEAERQSSRILAEVRIQKLSPEYLSTTYVQKVLAIGSAADAERYGLQNIRYSPESEQLTVVRALVLKSNGHKVDAEDLGDSSVADAQSAMYYDLRARNIRFPHLEAGDVIELEYRIAPFESGNPYGDYFAELVSFGAEINEELQRYVLIAPREIHIYSGQKGLPAPVEKSENGEIVYRWEGKSLDALLSESRSPSWAEQAPYVHVSTVQSWQDLGEWYAHLIAPQFALDAGIEHTIQQIRLENHTELERIRAVHEYVVKNTHYVAFEFGIYSYKPYPVTQTFARKFGDCKDKASLIIAMLRALGIEADIALVRTQTLGKIEPEPASVAIFDHAIAYVPKYDLWLDGTAEFSGLRELPTQDQGAMALTVSKTGEAVLRQIPVSSPLDNYTWRSVQAQLDSDGTLRFSGVNYVRGQDAPGMRRDCERVEHQREFVRNRLAEVLPSVEIQAVSVPGANNLEEDFTLSYRGEIQPRNTAGKISIPSSWIPRPYLVSLAAPAERHQPLMLPAPWTTEEELHIRLAKGTTVLSLPGDVHIENEFGSATLRYTKTKDELVVFSSVQFRRLRIAPGEYAAFRGFMQSLDESFHRELEVRIR